MRDEELDRRERRSQLACYRLLAQGSPGSFGIEPVPGVFASVVPVTAQASIANSVLYAADPDAVLAVYDDLARAYDEAGVRAWTVWVRPGDDALAAALEQRGHELDSMPALMGAPIDELDLDGPVELDLDPAPRWDVLAELNERAYGLPPGVMRGGFDEMGGMELLMARVDGAPVAGLAWLAEDGDCIAAFVATLPEARGRGLATMLMRRMLLDARDAGCTTATLEGSRLGAPVYSRLGYRTLGELRMMEHRA